MERNAITIDQGHNINSAPDVAEVALTGTKFQAPAGYRLSLRP